MVRIVYPKQHLRRGRATRLIANSKTLSLNVHAMMIDVLADGSPPAPVEKQIKRGGKYVHVASTSKAPANIHGLDGSQSIRFVSVWRGRCAGFGDEADHRMAIITCAPTLGVSPEPIERTRRLVLAMLTCGRDRPPKSKHGML